MDNRTIEINKLSAILKNIEITANNKTSDSFSVNSDLIMLLKQFNSLIVIISDSDGVIELNRINELINSSDALSLSEVKECFFIYKRIISKAVIQNLYNIYENDFSKIYEIERSFENYNIDDQVLAALYFIISDSILNKCPELSYKYGMKAFKLYSGVLKIFGLEKEFDIDNIKNNITDICPICNSSKIFPYKNIKQYLAVKNQKCFMPFKLWKKCNDCRNLFAYNFPVSEMGQINGHYTRNAKSEFIVPKRGLDIYSNIFNKCNKYTDGNKYLEIGVGNGEMLATALEFNYDVSAIEICREDCEKISSVLDLDIIWGDFLEIDIKDKFDIIIMGDVLEHVSAPLDAIVKANNLLSDNGVLWISTPNFESGFSRLMKDQDPMWNQLNHFTYFSYNGLAEILKSVGLKVVHYDVSNRYNGSMELYIKKL